MRSWTDASVLVPLHINSEVLGKTSQPPPCFPLKKEWDTSARHFRTFPRPCQLAIRGCLIRTCLPYRHLHAKCPYFPFGA